MASNKRFGTFEGVFTPTFLSILGVVMYLRLGWVVGSVGLIGAIGIIVLANLITLFTCLSISSITTNIRIGTGGAYSIISKSLGLEVGGAVGLPLYFSQAISVAFYVVGFAECWETIFPQHNISIVIYTAWFILLIISYASARLAFRVQYVIMAVIFASIISFLFGKTTIVQPHLLLEGTANADFWVVFAIFFPAVTGILAGVSMSGELKKPEESIPKGTIAAVLLSFAIYLLMAIRFSYVASQEQLLTDTSIVIQLGRWKGLIVAGIMGATISSALSMFVAAPRTLLALSKHRLMPFSSVLSKVNKKGEPTSAVIVTAIISFITLLLGTLDNIAMLLTMFFLITYGVLNMAVFIEQILGIVSFRPVFKIPTLFSFLGMLGCLFAMILITPFFSFIAILVIAVIYTVLLRGNVRKDWPDIRKGLFIFIAEKAIQIARSLPYHPKIWKPNILIPIVNFEDWETVLEFVKDMVNPSGRINLVSIHKVSEENFVFEQERDKGNLRQEFEIVKDKLRMIAEPLEKKGILVSSCAVPASSFLEGATSVIITLKNSIFPPNLLFMRLREGLQLDDDMMTLIERIGKKDMGILFLYLHPKKYFGKKKKINIWVREGSPNINLAVLIALKLEQNWDADIRVVQVVREEKDVQKAIRYIQKLKKLFRLSQGTKEHVIVGDFSQGLKNAPIADINVFGMPETINMNKKREIVELIDTTVLFFRDSEQESAIV
ncbi:MAG: amino acid permease [Candidatus Omnitrophica bacterium]|nr:amino acid permease [Candidatus Omnitrophota bacterium]